MMRNNNPAIAALQRASGFWMARRSAIKVPNSDCVFALAVAVSFGALAWMSLILIRQNDGIAAVWVANGVLLSSLFVARREPLRRMLLISCFVANVAVNALAERALALNLAYSAANGLEVLLAYWLIVRFSRDRIDFTRIDTLVRFVLIAGMIAPCASALFGTFAGSFLTGAPAFEGFAPWFIADALGLLLVTPAIVLIYEHGRKETKSRSKLEIGSLFALLVMAALAVFEPQSAAATFLVTPILLAIAFRLGPAFAAGATLLVAAIAFAGISTGWEPGLLNAGASMVQKVDFVQILVCTSFFTVLPLADILADQEKLRAKLAAEVAKRDALAADLMAQKDALNAKRIEIEIERNRLTDAIAMLPQGIVMLDAENRYVTWNQKYADLYKETAHLLRDGVKFEDATRAGLDLGLYPEAVGREQAWFEERMARISNPGEPHEQKLSDGRCILIEERRTSEGGLVSLRFDITEMKQREASTRLLFENNPVPMFVVGRNNFAVRAVNQASVDRYGYSQSEFSKLTLGDIQPGDLAFNSSGPHEAGQMVKHVQRNGSRIDVELYYSLFNHNDVPSYLIAAIDVTQRKIAEGQAAHMARHDPLTNLPNRNLLAERMHQAIARARRGDKIALLFLDLDNFKTVNDTLGHSAGDELLKVVAGRLLHSVRECDTVARLGGDEFAVLVIGAELPLGAATVAQRIIDSVSRPITLGTKEVTCGVSIGIAIAPGDAEDTAELFRYADLALYTAKDESRGKYRFFQNQMDEKVRARNALEAELKIAIAEDQLELHYQPILAVDGKSVACVEALVRWRHPDRGLIPPINFIPVAEETGMIVDIGEQVLQNACRDAASWPGKTVVAVNISAIELESPNLVPAIKLALAASGLPADRLQVEITETTLMKNVSRCVEILVEIGELGVGIAMDDFGTGYSSLSSLRSFPFDKIKIDRAFVKDLQTSAQARVILSTIVDLANTLGMRTTAEGVETLEQYEIVKLSGCSEVQGYLFHKPLPLADLVPLLAIASEPRLAAA